MIDVEFMGGYATIVAFRYLFTFLASLLVLSFGFGIYDGWKNEKIDTKFVKKHIIAAVGFVLVGAFLFSGTSAPRGQIDVPYKAKPLPEAVEIVTPPPRVEKLEGFVPLKP